MNNQFAMDKNVLKQLHVIKNLQNRSETTVQSLYAQAILEYSLYHYQKERIDAAIDKSLAEYNREEFIKSSNAYLQLMENHKDGKVISENGYELLLTFE
ncbi:hypothetical protein AJ85_11050 [Alkalihalobacillus alcalophilus ATCC 27647 = CGMCC 1.3604]|uniref:IDEAL domain-containing protein n=1 Tax=Alkalihalobacillus alcalophilus ATCC 27647 = CGMCC 1.3604 TaxID=1218173 RepID=A0A094YV13_ALKAL|nr:IDEAL domain-containing protein [Alkalihalobacillus alcalophilus]KGA97352.1 hypothetical protein BALCAV_0210590 [Alkalihalobacillus alcalophilus ATCC 27647 = CGMCC 1.3604]MED1560919.1 IDEAL domain-containing protein [Alkalihalobacillus alcalophilus]THG90381.1 hypothetical protein AJ85_11050 [Alkalihalobacillus alcalophilus ATCC 27647 = CGMCC 1.3604]